MTTNLCSPLSKAAVLGCVTIALMLAGSRPLTGQTKTTPRAVSPNYELNDSHFHLTNYIQEGTDIRVFLNDIMGTKVGRVALFGIPLQQQWSYGNTGDFAPTYYLQTDAPLYYYSFTDAYIHNDINLPFPKPDQEPYLLKQMRDLFIRHAQTTIIWAHCGLGRIVRPVQDQIAMIERALSHSELKHLYIDISWDEVAKYIIQTPESIKLTADLCNRYPDRFLFGTDEVAPADQQKYLKVYDMYAPLFAQLSKAASEKLRKGNYERLFDEARLKVRAWEKAQVK